MIRRILPACLAALALASIASSQELPYSLHLNDPVVQNRYVSITDKTGLEGNSAYTLEAWVRPTVSGGFPTILGNNYRNSFWLGLNSSGHVRFYPKGGAGVFVEGTSVIPLNVWTHVAVTYDAIGGARIYVNGSADGTFPAITGAPGTDAGDLRIGADREGASPTYFWQGNLDEIRIWSVVRSPAQIQATMVVDAGNPYFHAPGYAGLRAQWEGATSGGGTLLFDEANGLSEAFNSGTFVGAPAESLLTAAQGSPMSYCVGVELGGVNDYCELGMGDGFAGGVSIAAWIAPYTFTDYMTIAGRNFTSSFWLGTTPSGQLRFWPRGGTGAVDGPVDLQLNHWQFVEATYDGAVTKLYVNGSLVASSTAQTGPIGENGVTVWVGADHEGGTPIYPYHGLLDDVRIMRGVESDAQVKQRMWYGAAYDNVFLQDRNGVSQPVADAHFDGYDYHEVFGSSARLVRSGAPIGNLATDQFASYESFVPGGVSALPEDSTYNGVAAGLEVSLDQVITKLTVFVMAPIHDLANTQVRLISPLGTTVHLVRYGDARGRDLHTVFDDAGSRTLTTGAAPYVDYAIQPAEPLSTFNGEHTAGLWELRINSLTIPDRIGLWAWGIHINNEPAGVGGAPAVTRVALVNRSANPSRGGGELEFTLPRAADVDLGLFDLQGRRVADLYRGAADAGRTRLSWRGAGLSPGLYLARLRVDGRPEARLRLTLTR